jgi:hypothetical protein
LEEKDMSLTFLHPHIETSVIDNSFVFETATGGGTALFMPYFSDKGVDNKLELITSLSEFLEGKGMPNFKKHGQAIYNVVNWLRGGGRVFGMRLMPEDAAYANTILNVKTKAVDLPVYKKKADGSYEKDANGQRIPEVEADGTTPVTTPGVDIKLEMLTLTGLATKGNLLAQLGSIEEVDANGYTNHPVGAFSLKGRGEYGNKYSYRLSLNTSLEDTYDFRLYDFTILEKTTNGNVRIVEGPFQVSLFPEAVSLAGTSMFIGQVIKDYCKEVEMVFSDAAYDSLVDDIMESTKDASTGEYSIQDPQTLDVLFGYNKKGELEEKLTLENNTTAIDHFEGVLFESGSEGAFSTKNSPAAISQAKEQALVSAYGGITDPAVLNKKQFPIDIALDANFPVVVKQAIAQLASERKDVFGVLDTGVLPSASAAVAWRSNAFQESSWYCGIFGQSFSVYDVFTSMDIPVTSTYFLANKIPFNDSQYGVHFPFVGPTRGLVSGFKALDWNPNEYEKEDLYKARVNYVEQDFQNTKYMSQLTSQYKTSALSNINNVRVLMRMVRSIEELSQNYYFEFPNQATLNSFNTNIANILSEWVANGACSVARGTAYQNAYDKEQKIARVRVDVVFNNVIERILIEFNVGK